MSEELQDWVHPFSQTTDWLETRFGLPHGFIIGLTREDDWSFIIKAHALVEAAITNQLSASIDSRLTPVFGQLELSDARKGKIAFTKALGLVDNSERKFIGFLSKLRNELVHNIRKVTFSIDTHFASLDPNQRSVFIEAVTFFATNTEGWKSQAVSNPKSAIFAATLMTLTNSTIKGDSEKRERESVYERAKMLDDVIAAVRSSKS